MKFLIALLLSSQAFAVTFFEPSPKHYYFASTPQFGPAAAATDMCTIFGSDTKLIKIVGIEVHTNQSTTGTNQYYLIKRTTADTGGGANLIVPTPGDNRDATSTAVVNYYMNTNPTTGTSGGILDIHRNVSPVSTGLYNPAFNFIPDNVLSFAPIILRGSNEGVAVNFNGVTLPSGLSIGCTFSFIEE